MAAAPADAPVPVELLIEAIARGRVVRIEAGGHSMRPLIPAGSILELVGPDRPLAVGDVVGYARGSRLVIHRVHRVHETTIQTMGDGARRQDPPVHHTDVIGVVQRVTTPRGWVARLDSTAARPLGRVIVALVRAFRLSFAGKGDDPLASPGARTCGPAADPRRVHLRALFRVSTSFFLTRPKDRPYDRRAVVGPTTGGETRCSEQ